MGATAKAIGPTRQGRNAKNRVLRADNSIQSRTARDSLISALTASPFLDGFVVCSVVGGFHTVADRVLPGKLHDVILKVDVHRNIGSNTRFI